MTVYQLPAEVGAFAHHLGAVAARLVPGEGWYGVFASRDPDGLRACFEGTEIPPWDVVESLLQDLGEPPGGPEAARARALHGAAAAAHDRRPGGADALRARLAAAERERHHASARAEELGARLRVTAGTPDAGRTADELAWTADDHARATSRIAELTTRLTALARDGGVARGPAPAPLGRDGGLLRTPTPNPVPTPLVRGEGPARTPAPNPVPAPLVWGEGPARTPAPNPVPAPLVWGEGPAR
ncbi:UL36 very large tegument protein, partial [Streptomyces sp. P9(2023)]|nr:UL36 very large tegument protein [Streptomyces sp. P9(2023)]